jgi:hypothetical protein
MDNEELKSSDIEKINGGFDIQQDFEKIKELLEQYTQTQQETQQAIIDRA